MKQEIARRKRQCRYADGNGIVETTAAFSLMIPLFLLILHVAGEIVQAYMIKAALSAAAARAARTMIVTYWQDPKVASNRSLQDSAVYDKIRVNAVIASSQQFGNAVFDLTATPPVVTVTATYAAGKYGLAVFPSPDPLKIGNNFVISSSETQALE